MKYILFDEPNIRQSLLPLTFTRPTGALRIGIYTIAEKWEKLLKEPVSFLTEEYLQIKYSLMPGDMNMLINGAVCPTKGLLEEINNLEEGYTLVKDDVILAFKGPANKRYIPYHGELTIIKNLWDIFLNNGKEIRLDFELIREGRMSEKIQDTHTVVYNPENIFLEEGVKLKAAVLNAENGPIYLGKNSQVQEGAIIRGPFSLGEESILNMGAKMRADTTIGPYCKIGGEVSNTVIIGHSNKSHEGFLGNTVIGEWCNLGADTNVSNLKNNYGEVEIYNYKEKKFLTTGKQFCGLIMGDHSKTGINTMLNTGTVVGVSANIFGSGFPPKYIPSFSWGGAEGLAVFKLDKALEVAERVLGRRNMNLSEEDESILRNIYELDNPGI